MVDKSRSAERRGDGGLLWALALLGAASGACRGGTSAEPPMHWRNLGFIAVTNMNLQQKAKAQLENDFFADKRVLRPQVEGTVSTTAVLDDEKLMTGQVGGALASDFPMPLTKELLLRGQARFNIYCAPCHDQTGGGNGMVVQRAAGAMIKPPAYTDDRLLGEPPGYFFDVITHGVRTMPSYGYQVPVADRWAIVAYVRALQRSQKTNLADVPANLRSDLK